MCHTSESESVSAEGVICNLAMDYQMKENMGVQGDGNNNNFYSSYNNIQPFCPCMSGEKRIRRRHPATVQTPGRQMVEQAVMEPLVTNPDSRLESNFDSGYRDCNDNAWGNGEKFYEIQFVMDFNQMKTSDPIRQGAFDESATSRENRSKTRLLSSKLK